VRLTSATWFSLALLAAFPAAASAQAIVEHALGAGRAATTAAPAKGAGKNIGTVFDSLGRTLEKAAPQTQATTRKESAKAEPAKPKPVYEDPAGIEAGLEYKELLRRFGDPDMKTDTGSGASTLLYSSNEKSFEVEVRDGKVVAVKSVGKEQKSAAAVTL
jgi:hypothetical protein